MLGNTTSRVHRRVGNVGLGLNEFVEGAEECFHMRRNAWHQPGKPMNDAARTKL
jgi:hypothetical protein